MFSDQIQTMILLTFVSQRVRFPRPGQPAADRSLGEFRHMDSQKDLGGRWGDGPSSHFGWLQDVGSIAAGSRCIQMLTQHIIHPSIEHVLFV